MSDKPTLWGREPVAIVTAVEACILLAIGFGAPVTGEQVALVNAALLAVLALVARSKVTPTVNVVEQAVDAGTDKARVVAGPANEIAKPGNTVRPHGGRREGRGAYLEGQ
jgi:hypothetical protein